MQEAKQLFKRLKIYTLLDLALITPISYQDNTLSDKLEKGKINTLKVKVENIKSFSGKLKINFYLLDFDENISSIFFQVSSYHYNTFSKGSIHTIQGKLEEYNGNLQITQPKSIKDIETIIPKYKTVIKQIDIVSLIQCYITPPNLYQEGLTDIEVATIMAIHFPITLENIFSGKEFIGESLDILKFLEAFNHLKKSRAKKEIFPAIRALKGSTKEFIKNLPFKLTKEQKDAIRDIKKDLSIQRKASKRMVVGDVGSGKTMVILASAMMAYPHKTILMAPTSLLAIQLYEEALQYLPKDINIALVMQGREEGEYQEDDFIIGTHSLIFKDNLPKASLVMIDEQHRFGTKQRQSLEVLVSQEDKKPHFIQFSATPIPRTQAMMESELIDVSFITTTPFKKDISTHIIGKEDFYNLLTHIRMEIKKDHQILIVYPLVQESQEIPYRSLEESNEFWKARFDNVYVTSGRDKNKEQILLEFREQGSILLATTVVEVGISLPKLTLIVIVGAERLGLATLHQLRGRVSRNGLKSWCYLYSNTKENYRLERFRQTTNGFDIAKLDLKFRNSGDILDGATQSGQKFKYLDMGEDEDIVFRAKERLI